MKLIAHQHGFIIAAALIGVIGCSVGCSNSSPDHVVKRDLTPSERDERRKLYAQLRKDLSREKNETYWNVNWLEGRSSANYQAFLNLADESGSLGDEQYYEFVFRTESDSDPHRFVEGDAWLTIVVECDVIVHVNYDVLHR